MENLNTILGINLHTASIFDINEEKLLLLKSEDYYTKSDLFFFLQNELLKNKDNKDASGAVDRTNDILNQINSYLDKEKKNLN